MKERPKVGQAVCLSQGMAVEGVREGTVKAVDGEDITVTVMIGGVAIDVHRYSCEIEVMESKPMPIQAKYYELLREAQGAVQVVDDFDVDSNDAASLETFNMLVQQSKEAQAELVEYVITNRNALKGVFLS
jgi:hypothetical protein